jgi:hypothetical protein
MAPGYSEVTASKIMPPFARFFADVAFFGFAVAVFTTILPPAAEKALTS